MSALVLSSPSAPTGIERPVGAGAAVPPPLKVEPGQPHPLFSQAWADALTVRAAHIAHGHTAASDDAHDAVSRLPERAQ